MPRKFYPDPHPYKVLGLKAAPTWGHKQEIPSREQFSAYMTAAGRDAEGYDAWVAEVEAVKANNAAETAGKAGKADPASADPVPPVHAPAPASTPAAVVKAVPTLAHQRAKPETARLEVMSVRVREGIGARLDAYRAKHRASKQDVVSDVLDAFLSREGF